MAGRLSAAQVAALAESVRALLVRIESGELTASPALRHRLEGAEVALRAVLGEVPDLLAELPLDSK